MKPTMLKLSKNHIWLNILVLKMLKAVLCVMFQGNYLSKQLSVNQWQMLMGYKGIIIKE